MTRWLPPILLASYALLFGWRALAGGTLVFDDHPGQLYRLAHAITLGIAPWRLGMGWWAGYAELQYYPPGFAWLGAMLHAAAAGTLTESAIYQVLLWLAWLLPGASTYLLLRRALGEPWLALPGAFVALTLSAGCRSGVEEGLRWGLVAARLGWGVLPLLGCVLLGWRAGAARPPLATAPLVAAVTLLHPAHAPTAAALVLLAAWRGQPRPARLGAGACGLLAGFGLAAVWLLPLLAHLEMALPLAWADASPRALLTELGSQPVVLALAALAIVGWWRRARLPEAAAGLLGLAPVMAAVVALAALVVQPAGLAWLPADRLMDGLYLGLVLAGAAGFAALAASLRRPAPAALLAVIACLPLAWGPGEPGLSLWPGTGQWPKEHEVARGLRVDALWEALRAAPSGRVLFVRSAVPLDWRPEWWRPHTHLTALAPLRAGRSIVGGTFTHPSPVAGLLYTGSAAHRPLTVLAEQRDGRSLLGQPLEALDADTFDRWARRLGMGVVVILDQDLGRARFVTENPALRRLSRIGPFILYVLSEVAPEPTAIGPQRWRVAVSAAGPGWSALAVAYSPLWVARVTGVRAETRRSHDGLLEVLLPGHADAVELEHRPGLAEWAGLAVTVATLMLILAVAWRDRRA